MKEGSNRRKRNRLTVVCQRCRSKKAKCDKKLPCEACIRAKCPESCVYEPHAPTNSSLWEPLTVAQVEACTRRLENDSDLFTLGAFDPPSSLSSSSNATSFTLVILEHSEYLVGINPVILSEHMVNLHMDLSTPMSHINTFAEIHDKVPGFYMFRDFSRSQRSSYFLELSQQEPGINLFWKKRTKCTSIIETLHCIEPISVREELVAATKARFGKNYIPSIQEAQSLRLDINQMKQHFSSYGQYYGLSYDSVPLDNRLLETLKKILPGKYSLLGYVSRFFDVIYPVYPVLDESWVSFQIYRLFRFSNKGEVDFISITSHQDELIIGIILLMLRMAYVSFFNNVVSENEAALHSVRPPFPGSKPLKDCQISLSAVSIASSFIERGSKGQKVLLLTLQANLMQCILKMCSSESEVGFSAMRTCFNHAQLIQMAYTLSMERDPSYVTGVSKPSERACNLKRKLWYVLLRLDFTMSYLFNSPRIVGPDLYNTMLPQFSPLSSNIEDLHLEKEVCDLMSEIHHLMNSGASLLKRTQNVMTIFKACDCLQELTEFEQRVRRAFGTPSDYFQGQKQFKYACITLLTLNLQIQMVLKLFISQIHYFFYLYFKSRDDSELEFFFFRKVLSVMFLEMNIYCCELNFMKSKLVNPSFFFHISPILTIYCNFISLIGIGLYVRLNCSLLVAQKSQNSAHLVHQLNKLVLRCQSFVSRKLKLCKLLSERYFQAWKCWKTVGRVFKLLDLPEFFADNLELEKASINWTKRQQEELFNMIPENVPTQMHDVGDISKFCYYSEGAMQDHLLKGDDLLKTIQTDNFWICLHSLAENDTFNFPVKFEMELCMATTNVSTSFAESGVVDNTNFVAVTAAIEDGNQAKYGVQQSHSELEVHRSQAISPCGDYNAQQIIDFNMFSTDWSIDDFFQGPL